MVEKEGRVKDLEEKLKKGEITTKEGYEELKKRKLLEKEKWEIIPWVIYIILWVPFNIMFRDQLPKFRFPLYIIYISIIISVLGVSLAIWSTRMHYKKGGLKHDETVILIRDGPYSVMRHPGMGFMILFFLLPIILSEFIAFTPLSVVAIIVMIVSSYWGVLLEERKLDIPKWGNEYHQYMKEVPRFNFIKGYINLKKRKKLVN
ncbi:MAG: methyltransferase family protein [Candidatus Thorarchaeota archaeon]